MVLAERRILPILEASLDFILAYLILGTQLSSHPNQTALQLFFAGVWVYHLAIESHYQPSPNPRLSEIWGTAVTATLTVMLITITMVLSGQTNGFAIITIPTVLIIQVAFTKILILSLVLLAIAKGNLQRKSLYITTSPSEDHPRSRFLTESIVTTIPPGYAEVKNFSKIFQEKLAEEKPQFVFISRSVPLAVSDILYMAELSQKYGANLWIEESPISRRIAQIKFSNSNCRVFGEAPRLYGSFRFAFLRIFFRFSLKNGLVKFDRTLRILDNSVSETNYQDFLVGSLFPQLSNSQAEYLATMTLSNESPIRSVHKAIILSRL